MLHDGCMSQEQLHRLLLCRRWRCCMTLLVLSCIATVVPKTDQRLVFDSLMKVKIEDWKAAQIFYSPQPDFDCHRQICSCWRIAYKINGNMAPSYIVVVFANSRISQFPIATVFSNHGHHGQCSCCGKVPIEHPVLEGAFEPRPRVLLHSFEYKPFLVSP